MSSKSKIDYESLNLNPREHFRKIEVDENGQPHILPQPRDPRFPNQNQTKTCEVNYLDFHRCQKVKGKDYLPCDYFRKMYNAVCPPIWVERWDTQIEEGRFPAKI